MNTAWMQGLLPLIAIAYAMTQDRRSAVALLLFVSAVAHWYGFGDTDSDVLYYVSACTVDVLCALLLMGISSKLTLDMAALSLASALANLAGLAIWFAYYPPTLYNACIQIILGLQILRLLWVQGDDMARDTWFRRWGRVVPSNNLSSIRTFKGEA